MSLLFLLSLPPLRLNLHYFLFLSSFAFLLIRFLLFFSFLLFSSTSPHPHNTSVPLPFLIPTSSSASPFLHFLHSFCFSPLPKPPPLSFLLSISLPCSYFALPFLFSLLINPLHRLSLCRTASQPYLLHQFLSRPNQAGWQSHKRVPHSNLDRNNR